MATKKTKKKTTTKLEKKDNYKNSLFKFRGFGKSEKGICFGIDSILNTYLYATSLDQLNDAFEGTALYSMINEVDKLDKDSVLEKQTLDFMISGNLKIPTEFIEELRHNGFNSIRHIKEEYKKMAVFSASTNVYEHLLWAHYSQEFQGFAIEYDIVQLQSSLLNLNKDILAYGLVDYIFDLKSNYINYEGLKVPSCYMPFMKGTPEESMRALFFQKPKCWKYEKEFRFGFLNSGQKQHSHNSIKAIYFGPRATQENIEELVSQVRAIKEYDHVIFKRMKLKSRSFNLEEETLNY